MTEPQTSTSIDSAGRTIVFASGIDLPGDGTGTILTPQRKEIFAKTGVSAAVRKRDGWAGRKLSAVGPVGRFEEALKMANDMILESQRSGNINMDTPAYEGDPIEKMKPPPKKTEATQVAASGGVVFLSAEFLDAACCCATGTMAAVSYDTMATECMASFTTATGMATSAATASSAAGAYDVASDWRFGTTTADVSTATTAVCATVATADVSTDNPIFTT